MNIHLPFDDQWHLQNKSIRQALGLADDPRFTVQIYTSISHALSEVCFSLADLAPHKKTVAHFNLLGPDFDSVAVSLSKKELTLRKFSREEIVKPEYLAGLSKDLLMLVTGYDDPVTSARHDFGFLDEQLKEKRYFHIRVSNFTHFAEPIKLPSHYEIFVLSLSGDRTLVIAGERCKIRPELTPKLRVNWGEGLSEPLSELALFEVGRDLNSAQSEKLKSASYLHCQQVIEFEKDLPDGIHAFFKAGEDRIYDRSVLVCDGVDGLSLVSRLSEYVAAEALLETTSLCRWQNAKLFEYLGHPESIRGMVLIEVKLLNSVFKKLITKVYKELLSEQNEVLKF